MNPSRSSADEIDDLDLIPLGDRGGRVPVALDDHAVAFDRHRARIDVQVSQQPGDRHGGREGERVAVQRNGHVDRFYLPANLSRLSHSSVTYPDDHGPW